METPERRESEEDVPKGITKVESASTELAVANGNVDKEEIDQMPTVDEMRSDTLKLTKEEQAYIEHIKACCHEYSGFDMFQVMAVETDNGITSKIKHYFDILKALLCAAAQVFGVWLLLVDFITTGLENKGLEASEWMELCPLEYEGSPEAQLYHSNLKIMAFLFSSFLAMYSVDHLNHVEKGFYKNLVQATAMKWVSDLWIRFGLSINIVVSLVAVYGSFMTVFFSTNSLEMMLNSVALFFVVELDDMLVRKEDYNRILRYIEEAEYNNYTFKQRGCCRKCLNRMSYLIGCIYTTPFQLLRFITIGFCFAIPFFIVICY